MSPSPDLTVGELLERSTRRLVEAGIPDARADALTLIGHALGTDRGGVVARRPDPVDPEAAGRAQELIDARTTRRPIQQITGRVEFHGASLAVDENVLIPRPETEGLVDAVLQAGLPEGARVADLGTGSGCIAIALALARPAWRIVAVDVSPGALATARRNVVEQRVEDRVELVLRDFALVPSGSSGAFDAVVSNPPYVPEEEWSGLQAEVRIHEPKVALVPGPGGHEAYEAVLRAARSMLVPGGLVALELGWTSEAKVRELALREGFASLTTEPDISGIPRVLMARRP